MQATTPEDNSFFSQERKKSCLGRDSNLRCTCICMYMYIPHLHIHTCTVHVHVYIHVRTVYTYNLYNSTDSFLPPLTLSPSLPPSIPHMLAVELVSDGTMCSTHRASRWYSVTETPWKKEEGGGGRGRKGGERGRREEGRRRERGSRWGKEIGKVGRGKGNRK